MSKHTVKSFMTRLRAALVFKERFLQFYGVIFAFFFFQHRVQTAIVSLTHQGKTGTNEGCRSLAGSIPSCL